jgi:ribosomal protein S18 acetylase RimI-like enzyme
VEIVIAETTDPAALRSAYEIQRRAFTENRNYYVPKRTARAIASDGTLAKRHFIARCDGEIAGIIVCWREASLLHIGDVAVDPRFQGRSIGRALVEFVRETASAEAVSALRAATITEAGAVPFYQKLGFRIVRQQTATWAQRPDGGAVQETLLELPLS